MVGHLATYLRIVPPAFGTDPQSLTARLAKKAGTFLVLLDKVPTDFDGGKVLVSQRNVGQQCSDGKSGALGVKELVKWLNARGHRTRRGKTFGVGSIHKLLTNTIYIDRLRYIQTSSKTRDKKSDAEIIEISVLRACN